MSGISVCRIPTPYRRYATLLHGHCRSQALPRFAEGFTHLALDVEVRLQTDCSLNERPEALFASAKLRFGVISEKDRITCSALQLRPFSEPNKQKQMKPSSRNNTVEARLRERNRRPCLCSSSAARNSASTHRAGRAAMRIRISRRRNAKCLPHKRAIRVGAFRSHTTQVSLHHGNVAAPHHCR
jgi:hypothetical protein